MFVRRSLQRDELEVRVGFDRRADEAHLVARLAFDVEDFLTSVADVDERLLRVVLRRPVRRAARGMRKVNDRGPASVAATVTRTGATSPSGGSVIESRETMRPASSTTSGTRWPR